MTPWSGQVSHGEMIRETNDERMVLDPNNLQFLYQGIGDAENRDPNITGTRRMFEMIAQEPRLESTAVQTVGLKGYDGFAVLRVRD